MDVFFETVLYLKSILLTRESIVGHLCGKIRNSWPTGPQVPYISTQAPYNIDALVGKIYIYIRVPWIMDSRVEKFDFVYHSKI